MTMQNPLIAKARLQTLRRYLPVSQKLPFKGRKLYSGKLHLQRNTYLSPDFQTQRQYGGVNADDGGYSKAARYLTRY